MFLDCESKEHKAIRRYQGVWLRKFAILLTDCMTTSVIEYVNLVET